MATAAVEKVVDNTCGFLVSEGAGVDSRSADGDTFIQARHCREARDALGRANPSKMTLPLHACFQEVASLSLTEHGFHPDVMHAGKNFQYKQITEHGHAALPHPNGTVFKAEVYRLLGASDLEMENSPFFKMQDTRVVRWACEDEPRLCTRFFDSAARSGREDDRVLFGELYWALFPLYCLVQGAWLENGLTNKERYDLVCFGMAFVLLSRWEAAKRRSGNEDEFLMQVERPRVASDTRMLLTSDDALKLAMIFARTARMLVSPERRWALPESTLRLERTFSMMRALCGNDQREVDVRQALLKKIAIDAHRRSIPLREHLSNHRSGNLRWR
jgi:hypothetical protein